MDALGSPTLAFLFSFIRIAINSKLPLMLLDAACLQRGKKAFDQLRVYGFTVDEDLRSFLSDFNRVAFHTEKFGLIGCDQRGGGIRLIAARSGLVRFLKCSQAKQILLRPPEKLAL